MDMKVNIAIIGAGGIANSVHLPSLTIMKQVNVVAICDIFGDKAKKLADKFNIPNVYESYHKMLDEVKPEAVFVLTQPDTLFRIASDCLKMGVHVFMEKPMGITTFQAESLYAIAKEQSRVLHVGFNRRAIPLVTHVLSILRDITEINHVQGFFYKNGSASFYGGCASAFECDVVHCIDLVRHIAGGKAVSAQMIKNQTDSSVYNAFYSLISFDNGVTGVVTANYNTGGRVHGFEIHGNKASAYISLGFGGQACDARILTATGAGSFSISSKGAGNFECKTLDGLEIAGSDKYEIYYGYYKEDEDFVNSLINPGSVSYNIEEAVETMRLCDMLAASCK